jgi:hypothetical protein
MNVANDLGESRAIGQPTQALAIRELELIDVHNPIIATGHLVQIVQPERVVQVLVADAAVD